MRITPSDASILSMLAQRVREGSGSAAFERLKGRLGDDALRVAQALVGDVSAKDPDVLDMVMQLNTWAHSLRTLEPPATASAKDVVRRTLAAG